MCIHLLAGKGSWRRGLLLVLFCVLLGVGATAPRQAEAAVCQTPATAAAVTTGFMATLDKWVEEASNWAQNFQLLGEIISIVTQVYGIAQDTLKLLTDDLATLIALDHVHASLANAARTNLHNDMKATVRDSTVNGVKADIIGRNFRRPDVKVDCYRYLAGQALSGHYLRDKTLSNALLRMVDSDDLGPGEDGDGPLAAWKRYMYMCPPGNNMPKGMYLENDPPAACRDTTGKYAGMMTSAVPVSGAMVLEEPDLTDRVINNVTRSVVNPQTDEQRNFVAATVWIKNLSGFRPSPPVGRAMETHEGRNEMAQWNSCQAVRSALMKQCTDLVAKYTRPRDCTGSRRNLPECVASRNACNAARKAKYTQENSGQQVDVDVANMPGYDCTQGAERLSSYQVEHLHQLSCVSNGNAIGTVANGASPEQGTGRAEVCAEMWIAWQDKLTTEQDACAQAAAQVAQLKCWPKPSRTKAVTN